MLGEGGGRIAFESVRVGALTIAVIVIGFDGELSNALAVLGVDICCWNEV